MGAAGYVTIYDEAKVRAKYNELWPKNNLNADWWYLDTITVMLDGKRWIMDYADDQGGQDGSENDFWFHSERGEIPKVHDEFMSPMPDSQYRCLTALREVGKEAEIEVWT